MTSPCACHRAAEAMREAAAQLSESHSFRAGNAPQNIASDIRALPLPVCGCRVPTFPTEKMVQAGCDNITEQYRKSDWEDAKDMAEEFDCIRLFQAMLSAAPEPPA